MTACTVKNTNLRSTGCEPARGANEDSANLRRIN
jgi:hypothetical protein